MRNCEVFLLLSLRSWNKLISSVPGEGEDTEGTLDGDTTHRHTEKFPPTLFLLSAGSAFAVADALQEVGTESEESKSFALKVGHKDASAR